MTIRQSAQRAKHYAYIRARAVKRSQDRAKRAIATATRSWREASLSLEALGALRHRGWQRSASGVALVDSDGTPLPWLTYPAVDFLAQMRLSRMRVLEFGAGASTPWLGRRVDYLLSVEDDAQWFGRVERPERGDLVFKACTGDWYDTELPCGYVSAGDALAPWDLVIVDGKARRTCASHALNIIGPRGAVIVDDTQVPMMDPVRERMADAGLIAVDFYGLRPGLGHETCTTLFAKDLAALFAQ